MEGKTAILLQADGYFSTVFELTLYSQRGDIRSTLQISLYFSNGRYQQHSFYHFFLYLYYLSLFFLKKKKISPFMTTHHLISALYYVYLSFLKTFPKVFLSLQTYFPSDSFSTFSVLPCGLPSIAILWSCLSFGDCWLEKPWSKGECSVSANTYFWGLYWATSIVHLLVTAKCLVTS